MKSSDFTPSHWAKLRSLSKSLRAWNEKQCNGEIQCDDRGKCRLYLADRYGSFTIPGPPLQNEKEAMLAKAQKIASKYGAIVYHQEDPRGCALFVYKEQDLRSGQKIDCCYSLCALPCC